MLFRSQCPAVRYSGGRGGPCPARSARAPLLLVRHPHPPPTSRAAHRPGAVGGEGCSSGAESTRQAGRGGIPGGGVPVPEPRWDWRGVERRSRQRGARCTGLRTPAPGFVSSRSKTHLEICLSVHLSPISEARLPFLHGRSCSSGLDTFFCMALLPAGKRDFFGALIGQIGRASCRERVSSPV